MRGCPDAVSHGWASQRAWRPSPDDLVRSEQERLRDDQPETSRGLQVDDQLEPGRLLDGQVSRSSPLEDLVHVAGGAPKRVGYARPVGHEATRFDEVSIVADPGQPALRRQLEDAATVREEQLVRRVDEGAGPRLQH